MIAQLEMENVDETIDTVCLEADQKGTAANEFEAKLSSRIVGQERAVRQTSDLYQVFLAGMNPPNRPVGTMLFLDPTGSGKTRVVEAAAEVLFGDPNAVIKIDCAEFQHSHEIAKLINSPSAYLGNRDGEVLDDPKSFKTKEESKLSVLEYPPAGSLPATLQGLLARRTHQLLPNNCAVLFPPAVTQRYGV